MLGILSASTSAARGEKQQPSVSDQSGQNVHIINVLNDHHIRYIKDNGRKNTRVHTRVEDRAAQIEWTCLMTGTADSFRGSSER